MKKIVLLTCILIIPFLIFSQGTVKKKDTASRGNIYLDISTGLSVPMGYFARDDVKFGGSGFATPGFLGQINLDWMGKHSTGFAIQYTFQRNSLKSSVKNDTLTGMYKSLGSEPWTNHYLMAGLVYLHFIHNVYVEGRALIGVIFSSSPIFNTVDPKTYAYSTNTGVGLAIGVQFGAGYKISNRMSLKGSVEYLLGTPKIHHQYGAQLIGIDPVTGKFLYSAPLNVETKRTVSSLLLKVGIVVKLSK